MIMDNVSDHLDHQRWLIDNGFINDLHKDSLYLYGSLVHKDVKAVYCCVDVQTKLVKYEIYLDSKTLKKYNKFNQFVSKQLSKDSGIIDMWLFKRFIKNNGSFDFKNILDNFVKSYLNKAWSTELQIKHIDDYEEGFDSIE